MVVQTDSAKSILALSDKMMDRSSLGHIVEDVKELLKGERELVLVKISRPQNRVAYFLANQSRRDHLTELWFHDVPESVAMLLAADCISIT